MVVYLKKNYNAKCEVTEEIYEIGKELHWVRSTSTKKLVINYVTMI